MLRLEETIDPTDLERILESFRGATGLVATVVDLEGNLVFPRKFSYSRFCRLVRSVRCGEERCRGSYARSGAEAAKWGKPYIFRCHAGLVAWAAPIMVDHEHVGTITCGQVLMWEPEEFFWIELQAATRDMGLDFAFLKEEAMSLGVVPTERVKAAANLLYMVANNITLSGAIALHQRKKADEQQARINEEIQARKAMEAGARRGASGVGPGPLEQEEELLVKIRVKDQGGAQEALNQVLSHALLATRADPSRLQIRIIELLVLMSRAAIDAGANVGRIASLNYEWMRALSEAHSVEEQCLVASKALDDYLRETTPARARRMEVLERAMDHIRENHARPDLTLEAIARSVYLNPCYLSRLFSRDLGYTVTEYITQVRIEEAKKLLRNTDSGICEIGEKVGYYDPSHFSKIFKRVTKMSPRQYKEQFRRRPERA